MNYLIKITLCLSLLFLGTGCDTTSTNKPNTEKFAENLSYFKDQHGLYYAGMWRVPGFAIGVVLFLSSFFLIYQGVECFDEPGLKLRGLIFLITGGILYMLGGGLMFIGPHVL